MTREHIKYIDEIGRCELCGSRKNLQLHHIIPLVCEPLGWENVLKKPVQLDIEDNWIVVCSSCHSKLTPKNLLTKYGLNKKKRNNINLMRSVNIYKKFCEYIQDLLDKDIRITIDDYFDAAKYASKNG